MAWTNKKQPFGPNHAPLMVGLASDGSGNTIPVAVDPATGEILVNAAVGGNYNEGDTTSPANGNVLLGRYNASPSTLTEGQLSGIALDSGHRIITTLGTLISGEDLINNVLKVEQRFLYNAITTAATTVVKSGSGFLHAIIVTGGTAGTIDIYDNTSASGTKIASFDSTNALATYLFDATATTGITIVTGAATKLTVIYR